MCCQKGGGLCVCPWHLVGPFPWAFFGPFHGSLVGPFPWALVGPFPLALGGNSLVPLLGPSLGIGLGFPSLGSGSPAGLYPRALRAQGPRLLPLQGPNRTELGHHVPMVT